MSEIDYGYYAIEKERAEKAEARVAELEKALEPFARCVQRTDEFLARTAENSNVMERRDLFMWQAPRSLCVNDFRVAAKTLGL